MMLELPLMAPYKYAVLPSPLFLQLAIKQMEIFPNNFTCALAVSLQLGACSRNLEENHKVAMCTRK